MTEAAAEATSPSRAGPVAAALLCGAATWWLADAWDAQRLAHLAVWVVLGLVMLPLGFVVGLGAVGAVLLTVLAALSVPGWLSGRPVGLGGVARDLVRLVSGILPDYWRALQAVQKPWLWGAASGFVLGVAARLVLVGLTPT
jgi:hypothetical protein